MRRILFILLLRSFLPLAALRPAEPYFGDSLLYALSMRMYEAVRLMGQQPS